MTIQIAEEVAIGRLSRDYLQTLTREQLIYLAQEMDLRNRRALWEAGMMIGSCVYNMPKLRRILGGTE